MTHVSLPVVRAFRKRFLPGKGLFSNKISSKSAKFLFHVQPYIRSYRVTPDTGHSSHTTRNFSTTLRSIHRKSLSCSASCLAPIVSTNAPGIVVRRTADENHHEISFQDFVLGGQILIEISRNLKCRQGSVFETNFEKSVSRVNADVKQYT